MTGSSRVYAAKLVVARAIVAEVLSKPRSRGILVDLAADGGFPVEGALRAVAERLEMRWAKPGHPATIADRMKNDPETAAELVAAQLETPWESMAVAAATVYHYDGLLGAVDEPTRQSNAFEAAQREAPPGMTIDSQARDGWAEAVASGGQRLAEHLMDHDSGWAADQPWAVRARRELAADFLERAEPGELGDEVKDAVVEWIEGWLREGWEGATRRETLQTGGIARAGQLFADLRSSVTANLTGDRATARPANGWAFRLTRLLADDDRLLPPGATRASAVWAEMPGAAPATGATSSAAGRARPLGGSSIPPKDRGRESR